MLAVARGVLLRPVVDTYPVAQAHRNWPLTALGIPAAER